MFDGGIRLKEAGFSTHYPAVVDGWCDFKACAGFPNSCPILPKLPLQDF